MVETGEKLEFKRHCWPTNTLWRNPGTRTNTDCMWAIVAAAGFKNPQKLIGAITTPDGTADDMEVLAPVELSKEQIYKVVEKTNGCVGLGRKFLISAPADDIIIQVEKPLLFESFDKVIVSIMAKKIAFGSNHVVIRRSYGKSAKVHNLKDTEVLKSKFEYLAKKFGIRIRILVHRTEEPAGKASARFWKCGKF